MSRLKETTATCTIQLSFLQVPADIEVAVRLVSLLVCSSLLGEISSVNLSRQYIIALLMVDVVIRVGPIRTPQDLLFIRHAQVNYAPDLGVLRRA